MNKEELKQAIREVLQEMEGRELYYAKFVPVDVPVPKFNEYKVSIPVVEERVHVIDTCAFVKARGV